MTVMPAMLTRAAAVTTKIQTRGDFAMKRIFKTKRSRTASRQVTLRRALPSLDLAVRIATPSRAFRVISSLGNPDIGEVDLGNIEAGKTPQKDDNDHFD
jgi:hypothetical protein